MVQLFLRVFSTSLVKGYTSVIEKQATKMKTLFIYIRSIKYLISHLILHSPIRIKSHERYKTLF